MATHCIVGGPSKWDMILALFEGNSTHRRKVTFKITSRLEKNPMHPISVGPEIICDVIINHIAREDGGGESWNFRGYTTRIGDLPLNEEVSGFYSTADRKGSAEFAKKTK